MATNNFTFVDRKVSKPNSYKMTDGATIKEVILERAPGTVITPGVELNAANLNAAFATKQNKLTAGSNITIVNDVISANINNIDYSIFAPDIGSSNHSVNKDTWTLSTNNYQSYENGKLYLANYPGYYSSFSTEFEVSNISYNTSIDADPTIAIRAYGSWTDNSVYILYRLTKKLVRIIRADTWTTLGEGGSDVIPTINIGDSFKVRVVKFKKDADNFRYNLYFNGQLAHYVDTNFNLSGTVSIGSIGCKPEKIKYYKVESLG